MNKKVNFSRMTVLSKEDGDKLTDNFINYFNDLNDGLRKIMKTKEIEDNSIHYSMDIIPIPSSKEFYYDRNIVNIDDEISELLSELKTNHY